MPLCDHCLAEVSPSEALTEELREGARTFCCPACQGIYHLLRDEGLEDFYRGREGWSPGRPEAVEVHAGLFEASVRPEDGQMEADLAVSGIRCASCVWLIERYLMKDRGVAYARVNHATHRARIRWDPQQTGLEKILRRITSIGYTPRPFTQSSHDEMISAQRRDLQIRLATAAFFSAQIMLFSIALYEGYFQGMDPASKLMIQSVLWALATPVMFYSGFPFIRNTIRGLAAGGAGMDTLVFIGSASAYTYSAFSLLRGGEVYFETSSMIITLILLGRLLEAGARGRAAGAISALMGLQPPEARSVRDTAAGRAVSLVPVSGLKAGDLMEVLPGGSIPLDARVVEGESDVDESMLTGEPMPVRKSPGAEVFAGTANLNGALVLSVARPAGQTVLSGIIRTVEEAQARRAPIEGAADRVVAWFVPAILLAAAATFLYWRGQGVGTASALMNAVSVLVVACPCALGLATPMAILAGTSLASREGILIRGGDVLEAASRAGLVVFDKTGTLTAGRPALLETIAYGVEEAELRRLAASLERNSEHTVARALSAGIVPGELYPVSGFRAHPGGGVEGLAGGKPTAVGSARFLGERGVRPDAGQSRDLERLSSGGRTVVGLASEERLLGWLAVADRLRSEAPRAVRGLIGAGHRVMLVTGDGPEAARRAAEEAGIPAAEVLSGASPAAKAEKIRSLREEGFRVLMVGDGINDAPALAEADVGMAMGRATDIAMKSADVVLMREDLELVPSFLRTARRSLRAIRQNLFWAFSYNAVAVPLAVTGRIHPIASAALMAASSLMVAANSLRLGRRQGR
jgi:Cu2+-exporting ATPase